MSNASIKRQRGRFALAFLLPLLAIGVSLISCQSQEPKIEPLPDGLFPVIARSDRPGELEATSRQRVLIHDMRYVKAELRPEPTWIVLPTKPGVALDLAEAPTATDDALHLTFTKQASDSLRSFTGRNIDRSVAVVIGGEVVTVHVIRTALDSGKLQISC